MGVRGGLPVGPRPLLPDHQAQDHPSHRLRPRRKRSVARGGRAGRPPLPARARPPRRQAAVGAARAGRAQAGHARIEKAPGVRIAFLGTPEAAVPPLRALVADGHDVAVVVTQPDRKRGRGGALVPSPVKAAALELGLDVAHDVDAVLGKGIELGVVVAFGKLIKAHVLAQVPMVNIHFSLLPRWRGAAPLERAILAGDAETGVCLMGLETGLDTGPVYECERLTIGADETADELRARLVEAGTAMLRRRLRDGLGDPVAQVG